MTKPAVSARAVFKHFGATRALANVDFELFPGEVHALIGENGAGKSTLVRILGGVHRPDQGEGDVSAGLDRFTVSVRRNSDPADDRLLKGTEVARDAPTCRSGKSVTAARKANRAIAGRCR